MKFLYIENTLFQNGGICAFPCGKHNYYPNLYPIDNCVTYLWKMSEGFPKMLA